MRRAASILVWVVAVVVLASAAYIGVRRVYGSDPSRSLWCRLATCPSVDRYDHLCRAFARSELAGFSSEQLRAAAAEEGPETVSLLDDALARPAPERLLYVLGGAREAGAPRWQCPALARQLPNL